MRRIVHVIVGLLVVFLLLAPVPTVGFLGWVGHQLAAAGVAINNQFGDAPAPTAPPKGSP